MGSLIQISKCYKRNYKFNISLSSIALDVAINVNNFFILFYNLLKYEAKQKKIYIQFELNFETKKNVDECIEYFHLLSVNI